MNSLTMIAHGVASGRRQGRSRAWSSYQLKIRRTTVRAWPTCSTGLLVASTTWLRLPVLHGWGGAPPVLSMSCCLGSAPWSACSTRSAPRPLVPTGLGARSLLAQPSYSWSLCRWSSPGSAVVRKPKHDRQFPRPRTRCQSLRARRKQR